jgi:RND family efflux transporter MFP subunit
LFDQVRGDVGASDADLLGRFVADGDQAAFELLVWRHRHLVFGVCRRVLHDFHDAEDAFQATFLTLARKAGSIGRRQALASWLYRVAHRVALTARSRRARRSAREQALAAVAEVAAPGAETASDWKDLWPAVDEELGRLPERYRAAAILCYLEGKTVEEAAGQLGCPRGTVASRLARARDRLRTRLARRGLTPPPGALPVPHSPAVDALVHAAVQIALAASAVSGRVVTLSQEALNAMFLQKLIVRTTVLLVGTCCLLAGGGLVLRMQPPAQADPPPAADPERPAAPAPRDDKPARKSRSTITVRRPIEREFTPFEVFTGRTEARRIVTVQPRIAGVLSEVRVRVGDAVKKGDVLFELDSRPLQAALDKATADLAQAIANRKAAEGTFERTQKLYKQYKDPSAGEADLAKARAGVDVARAACQAAQSSVELARLDLDATRIVAPIDGRLVERNADVGDVVGGLGRATRLAQIVALDPMGLKFLMDEDSYLRYQRLLAAKEVQGSGGPLFVALAHEKDFSHRASLDRFGSQFDPERGTIDVYGSLPNAKGQLLPGQFVRVRMPFGKPRKVLEVPEEAVCSDQGKRFVLVVNDRNVVERRSVTTGAQDGEMRIILNGLTASDRLIVAGINSVQPGDVVK